MKRHVKKGGMAVVLSLFFVLGGLFLVNDVHAQQHTVTQVQPQQSWISPFAAMSVVQAEINLLTAQYQQMQQAGVEPAQLQKVKLELNLYMRIQQALNNGMGTQAAYEFVWENSGIGLGADATSVEFLSPAEANAIHDKLIGKLTD